MGISAILPEINLGITAILKEINLGIITKNCIFAPKIKL
jgi:hypothetical protein